MAKQRQSVQKRIREQKKREREQRKREKSAAKAERRLNGPMTEEEYGKAMARIEELMDMDAKKDSPEGAELDRLARRAEGYEREHDHLGDAGQEDSGAIE